MHKPTVAIIYPYWLEERTHTEDVEVVPIGAFAVAAALLDQGYDAHLLDWHIMRGREAFIESELRRLNPDVVSFSVLMANRFGAIDIARIAKRINPDVKIIFGGVAATSLWEFFLRNYSDIDAVVVGEGDLTMPELVGALARGSDLGEIDGIAYRKDGVPTQTTPRQHVCDLDTLPIPAKWFTYRHLSLTRGCPGRCTFCGSPALWGPKVRFRSPRHFVDEMEMLAQRGADFLYVSDDTFTLDKKRVIAVCREILDRNLKIEWQAISRVNAVDDDVLRWMRKAGCIQISYGVESGDPGIRSYLNKNIKEDDVARAFTLSHKYGILARAYFIYGCPGENDDTIKRTFDCLRRIKPLVAHFFILSLFPGTALYDDYKQATGATDDIWLERKEDIKYFEHDPHLDLAEVERLGNILRTEYHKMLPGFADAIELTDDPEFAQTHADFLARLGMTFQSGDYAANPLVDNAPRIAQKLHQRALEYHPDTTAALGLGLLLQKQRLYPESIRVFAQGLTVDPKHEKLSLAVAISLMNCGDFEKALAILEQFPGNSQADNFARICRQQMV